MARNTDQTQIMYIPYDDSLRLNNKNKHSVCMNFDELMNHIKKNKNQIIQLIVPSEIILLPDEMQKLHDIEQVKKILIYGTIGDHIMYKKKYPKIDIICTENQVKSISLITQIKNFSCINNDLIKQKSEELDEELLKLRNEQ